jgi:UDP-N-acetylmuramate dehydrogenase
MINTLKQYGEVTEHASLKNMNTYHIDGKAKILIEPNSINDLVEVIKTLREYKEPYFILGAGSNIVLNDKEIDGVVIKFSKLNGIEVYTEEDTIYAEAGAMLPKVVIDSVNNGLCGLEFAAGIPGTIGGAVYGNAGAYNACIMDYVKSVTVLDQNNEIVTLENDDIFYEYRNTMFKQTKKYIILGAKLYLREGSKEESESIMADRKKRRVESQPLEFPNAGSVFRNPEGDFAGRLIEECELKGYRIGGAEVSTKHANFIINKENATGKDVHDLILHVHDTVKEKTGVDLLIEQEFVDWE